AQLMSEPRFVSDLRLAIISNQGHGAIGKTERIVERIAALIGWCRYN
ncbi:MAG: hypothetical protein ACI9YG_001870, partial [Candidatus Azotimanducaceae bacterium]